MKHAARIKQTEATNPNQFPDIGLSVERWGISLLLKKLVCLGEAEVMPLIFSTTDTRASNACKLFSISIDFKELYPAY